MAERTHMANQNRSANQSPSLVVWRAHMFLCGGIDIFDTRLVTNRPNLVTCKICQRVMAKNMGQEAGA